MYFFSQAPKHLLKKGINQAFLPSLVSFFSFVKAVKFQLKIAVATRTSSPNFKEKNYQNQGTKLMVSRNVIRRIYIKKLASHPTPEGLHILIRKKTRFVAYTICKQICCFQLQNKGVCSFVCTQDKRIEILVGKHHVLNYFYYITISDNDSNLNC